MLQTFTPKQYLQIDIANSYGLDKLTWDQRLEWFQQNEHQLMLLLPKADNPAMYYAGVKAWMDYKKGEPIGYPVSLDATSSGIQILAVLTGDKSAAQLSNVLDTGKRGDAYNSLFELMSQKAGTEIKLERKPVKSAIMTAFYGSEAVPRDVFGEGPLLKTFYDTLEEATPGAWEINKALLELWDPKAMKYSWVMPDNFHVHIKVTDQVMENVRFMGDDFTIFRTENRPIEQGRSLSANMVHSVDGFIVRELMRRCNYDSERIEYIRALLHEGPGAADQKPSENTGMVDLLWALYEKSGYLSARILDFLDSTNIHLVDDKKIWELLESLPRKPFQVIAVHDCFRVHPNYGNDLRRQYNLQLSLIAESNMLEFLLSQMLGKHIPIHKLANFSKDILDSNYALS